MIACSTNFCSRARAATAASRLSIALCEFEVTATRREGTVITITVRVAGT